MSVVSPIKWQNNLRDWPSLSFNLHARRTNQNRSPRSSTACTVSNPVQNCGTMGGILGVTCCRKQFDEKSNARMDRDWQRSDRRRYEKAVFIGLADSNFASGKSGNIG